MANVWQPSDWGRRITRAPQWQLQWQGGAFELHIGDTRYPFAEADIQGLQVVRGLPWSRLEVTREGHPHLTLGGLANDDAKDLAALLADLQFDAQQHDRQTLFTDTLEQMHDWLQAAQGLITRGRAARRWISHEQQQSVLAQRPVFGLSDDQLDALFHDEALHGDLESDAHQTALDDLHAWQLDWPATWQEANEDISDRELTLAKDFLDSVERKPLTEEQARAVVCFDNRVQVVAAAGSGKTSTMVAKAAYAIERGFVAPDRVVLLAFNKDAAAELQQRAAQAFARLGMADTVVEARTFHALGLQLIGKATGRKPDVPDWAVDAAQGFSKLAELVDGLKDRSRHFRTQWDMFRLVFCRDLPSMGTALQAEGFDRDGTPYVRTLQGERVKSLEECIIADWLFYHGVRYEYERKYEFDTATDTYRQYRPDFYYPDADLYHEHFALDAHGRPPAQFDDYMDGVAWKREEHRRRATALIETTSFGLRSGADFAYLADALTEAGIVLDPNPDRALPDEGAKPMPDADLVGLMRTFIAHAKSNCLSLDDMAERLRELPEDQYKERHRRFLEIAGPVLEAWDDALADEGCIDFEDMLNMAAGLLEQGQYSAPYELVMVDEFQDASRARARLCRALVNAPGRHLFAVGDDWQSINRFAGADVSVMTGFREWFGHGQVLKLEQTFRCPQELCDASSQFVSANPAQLDKQVRSVTPARGPVLQAFQLASREQIADGIRQYLDQLQRGVLSGEIAGGRDGKVSVFVLGRYNNDRNAMPAHWQSTFGRTLDVRFMTVHRSKGMEADYVILPGMLARSFPSTRADDPALTLAMPSGDTFPLGEERRLFYVALTRARRSVAMFTVQGKRSPFLEELVRDGAVEITGMTGEVVEERRCHVCDTGVFVERNGKHGVFWSCSGYPNCYGKPVGR